LHSGLSAVGCALFLQAAYTILSSSLITSPLINLAAGTSGTRPTWIVYSLLN
ncbi:hypothetical protein DOT_2054, partial [Desulfosporosinus sp. OT]